MPANVGLTSIKYTNAAQQDDYVTKMQKEIARLENENIIMKKRLKKMLNLE